MSRKPIPIIDIFAGPGGLGEGFARTNLRTGDPAFRIVLSIEKDLVAWQTLRLRAFFRQFPYEAVPDEYFAYLRGEISDQVLFERYPKQARMAQDEAWQAELGSEETPTSEVHQRISKALGGAKDWVLIGGPPCQAYSLAGRSRNKGNKNYVPEDDPRQYLYREYLKIIAGHWPSVFVMENVKGLVTAQLAGSRIVERILADLRDPEAALRNENTFSGKGESHFYDVYPLSPESLRKDPLDYAPTDFLVEMERHGIPQTRHRLIIVGIRRDLDIVPGNLKEQREQPSASVLEGLPRLRSGLSSGGDSLQSWKDVLGESLGAQWFSSGIGAALRDDLIYEGSVENLKALITRTVKRIQRETLGRGGAFVEGPVDCRHPNREWFLDDRIGGLCNHESKTHMRQDLHRYLFAACFSELFGDSPTLDYYPTRLLPKHKSADRSSGTRSFADRFFVHPKDAPSRTVLSHYAKDGHYAIHYDPVQCRSLTVREAARLQTFPDNYFFCGPKTHQYTQVGNAVPPLLAKQVAEVVLGVLVGAGIVVG